jgi:diaminopimelate decarboxylase
MQNLNTPVVLNQDAYTIQGIDLLSLGATYGSPIYVYDLDHILARYKSLTEAITWPRLCIHYAMKANYNLDILKALKEAGAHIDAVSPAEVFFALKAGFTKEEILYTANNLTAEEIHLVHNLGVLLNIDSLSCLKKFGAAFPGSEVCLRFNSDVVAGEHEKVQTGGDKTKFGINLEDAAQALEIVARFKLKVVGLHEHTGSGIAEAEQFYQGMKNLLAVATKERFPDLRFVDFGGGFKVPYRPDDQRIDYATFGRKATAIFADFCQTYGHDLDLYFEPGKYLVAEGGVLLMQVNTIKDNRGRLIAGTDSGFGHLIRPMLYDAYHHILNISNPQGASHTYDICGNICETGDLFASDRDIPEIREGDTLAVLNAGAYCFSMASVYNLRPLPTEIVIRNGVATLSRRSISSEALADEIYATYRTV